MLDEKIFNSFVNDLNTISTIWNDLSEDMQDFLAKCFAGEKDTYKLKETLSKLS